MAILGVWSFLTPRGAKKLGHRALSEGSLVDYDKQALVSLHLNEKVDTDRNATSLKKIFVHYGVSFH